MVAFLVVHETPAADLPIDFDREIRPILTSKCVKCHGASQPKAGLQLNDRRAATKELESGSRAVVPGKPAESELLRRVESDDPDQRMPPTGTPLTNSEIAKLRQWIEQGAVWSPHWAYRPLLTPAVPTIADPALKNWCRTPLDRFVAQTLQQHGLTPSPEADRRTLLRRVYFDLIGLPPTLKEQRAYLADPLADAYDRVVEKLLASPHYGERWARHWMDLVHFAESHGQDQDRPREHAWRYRDYLIQAFNDDKPYARFVEEQIAGDVLFPDDPAAIVATGFLAAGPWDESSLRDIQENSLDREIARYLDRDDIVTTVMSTFASTTAHCARCHDHKFDPITQVEYHGLQAVFAGIDKANRPFDADPKVAARRRELTQSKERVPALLATRDPQLLDPALLAETAAYEESLSAAAPPWQVLTASDVKTGGTLLTPQEDGSLLAGGPRAEKDTYSFVFSVALKKITALRLEVLPHASLPQNGPGRQDNGNLHLSELRAFLIDPQTPTTERRLALKSPQADFNQQGWSIEKALDGQPETAWGIFPEVGKPHQALFELSEALHNPGTVVLRIEMDQVHGGGHLIGRLRWSATDRVLADKASFGIPPAEIAKILAVPREQRTDDQRRQWSAHYLLRKFDRQLAQLPPQSLAFCGTNRFTADGSFRPSATPRSVRLLHRGNILDPREEVSPAALACVAELEPRFALTNPNDEGQRRAALARWLTSPRNVLAWRSIANRLWHYHFGQGLVDSPNDFGQMGTPPTHPELLDFLATTLQQQGGSLKSLHHLIVTSAVYRQSSAQRIQPQAVDQTNRWLWRMNRRRLDAESIRDSLLLLSGTLDPTRGGPSVRQFVQSPGVHVTPVVDYLGFNADDPANNRRSIYRFLFRTLPDPFMESLDCPDASQLAPKRVESVTALQALATLNDKFIIRQSTRLSDKVRQTAADDPAATRLLFETLFGRAPTAAEQSAVQSYIARHGLANACRFLINTNEFMFVD